MPITFSQGRARTLRARRSTTAAVGLFAIACAGSTSQTDVASKGGVPSVTRVATTDPNLRLELGTEAEMYSEALAAPPDSVWGVLPEVYATLELPVTVFDPDTRTIGTMQHRPRRIEGERLSRYLDCGEGMTATPYADLYEVTLSLSTQVRSTVDGSALLVSEMRATARERAVSGNAIPCTSHRRLEERIVELAAHELGAPPRE